MTENERKLYEALERIVSYYDSLERGFRGPSMDDQAKSKHENTMFGEARKVLKEVKTEEDKEILEYIRGPIEALDRVVNLQERIVKSKQGNGKPAVKTAEKCDATNPGTGD